MGIPLPALSVHQEPQPGPLDQYAGVMRLKSLMGGQQLQQQQLVASQQENQMREQAIKDQKAQTAAMQEWDGKSLQDLPPLLLKHGGSATAVMGLKKQILDQQTAVTKLSTDQLENQAKMNDMIAGHIESVKSATDKQSAYDAALTDLEQKGLLKQGQIPHQYPGDQQLDQIEKGFMGGKAQVDQEMKAREVAAQEMAAQARMKAAGKGPEGENPLGDKVPQLNDALTARFQVLNPGQPLPPYLQVPANATQKDYDRIDKLMESQERAKGTKAQLDTTNAMREQTAELARENASERKEKDDLQPVIGTDPKSGKTVLVPLSQAKTMGITDGMKAGEQEVTKAQAARHWIPLAEKQGDTPDTMGIIPLIDKLDKEGKLGVVASRWNDFMAGKVGAGDPGITALRTKMGLSTTLLMNAHVGNRGGAYMLEHFEDLANSGKMNAETLRTGVKSELDYVKDRAMLPGSKETSPQHTAGGKAQGLQEGQTGTGSDGKKYVVKGGVWVPAQ